MRVAIQIYGLAAQAEVTYFEPATQATEFEPPCGPFVEYDLLTVDGAYSMYLTALYERLSNRELEDLETQIINAYEKANNDYDY